jgi:hypothetical protein
VFSPAPCGVQQWTNPFANDKEISRKVQGHSSFIARIHGHTAVHTYQLSGTTTKPFVPGIYCGYTTSGGKYVVPADIQTVFDNAATYWTHSNVRCRGLWTAEPFLCKYCTSTADVSSDWGQFATAKQTLQTGTVEVPLYLWQYAEPGYIDRKGVGIGGCKYACNPPYPDFAGGQNLDLDGSDSRGGETYMFKIVS